MKPTLPIRAIVLLICFILVAAQGLTQRPLVAVVTVSDVDAYAKALQGLREQLPDIQVLDARDEDRIREHFKKAPPALAIAVGSGAAATLERVAPAQLNLMRSVVLASELETGASRFKTAVTIDVPPDALLAEVARLFPQRKKIGLIRGPQQNDAFVRAFEAAGRRKGMVVEVVKCDQAKDLVDLFLSLRGRADLVWCPPNPQLYNSATLKPLLMASLTNRLPIIGFSEQFVQAGALFGGTADFVDVGRQTATLAARMARNETVPPREEARKFQFAYNQRVARLLGVKAVVPEDGENGLKIIR